MHVNHMNAVPMAGMETMGDMTDYAVHELGEMTMAVMMANGGGNDKPKPQPKPEPATTPPADTARQALQQSMDRRW